MREAKTSVPVPVIGNGDIATPEDAAHRLRTSGCRGIAIGRGARGRPWLFRQINASLRGAPSDDPALREPSTAERVDVGLEHIRRQQASELARLRDQPGAGRRPERVLEEEAGRRALGALLPHVMWYVWGAPGAAAARRMLSQARSATELAERLADFRDRPEMYAQAPAADSSSGANCPVLS